MLILLAVLTARLAFAQDFAERPAPLPVIEGKVNDMDVMVQGDSVAFFTSQLPGKYTRESCAEDLHARCIKPHQSSCDQPWGCQVVTAES